MNKFLLVGVAMAVSGCATMLPKEQRQAEFIDATSASKDEAYSRALAYLAKNLGDSNYAIKMKDDKGGQIVTQMNVQCHDIRQSALDLADYHLDFALDFQAKDKRVRSSFEDVKVVINGKVNDMGGTQISDAASMEKAKTACLDPIRKAIVAAVNGADRSTASKKDW